MFSISQLVLYQRCCWGLLIMAENNITIGVSYEDTYRDIPIMTISIFGVVSNGLLLLAFFKDPLKCFKNSATHFVTNLSISDFLTCLFALFFHITANYMTADNREIILFLIVWFGSVSLASLTSISIDRFLMVAYTIKHRILMKGKVIVLWLAVCWIVGCALSVMLLLNGRKNKKINIYMCGAIIITISAAIYAATYHKLKKQSRKIALQNPSKTLTRAQEIRTLKEKQFLKTIIIIACIAFACVVPSLIFFQINGLLRVAKGNSSAAIFKKILISVFYVNFAVNPLIYILRLPIYRKTFCLLYCKRGS